MFGIVNIAVILSPIARYDIKLGIIKFQKYMFRKNLQKIF